MHDRRLNTGANLLQERRAGRRDTRLNNNLPDTSRIGRFEQLAEAGNAAPEAAGYKLGRLFQKSARQRAPRSSREKYDRCAAAHALPGRTHAGAFDGRVRIDPVSKGARRELCAEAIGFRDELISGGASRLEGPIGIGNQFLKPRGQGGTLPYGAQFCLQRPYSQGGPILTGAVLVGGDLIEMSQRLRDGLQADDGGDAPAKKSGWAILGQSARSPGEVGPDRQKRRPGLNSRICHGAQDSRAWNEKGPRRIAGLLRVQEVRTQARRRRAATSPPRPSRAMLPEVGTIWPETCVATLLRF